MSNKALKRVNGRCELIGGIICFRPWANFYSSEL